MLKTLHINFIFLTFLLTACGKLNTEGILNIKGKVVDERTGKGIQYKNIVIQGIFYWDNKLEAGQFSTDSSGFFEYSLKKIKGIKRYNFCFVGDSDNLYTTQELSLYELQKNADFLLFSLKNLATLTIKINRKSKTPQCDTLCLDWESDGVYFWFLYPYSVSNFGKLDYSLKPPADMGLTWIGGIVNSTVKTRVFADKRTKVRWELYRYGHRKYFTDTITCRRGIENVVSFKY